MTSNLAIEQEDNLFMKIPQPMWIVDLSALKIIEINEAAKDFYGFTLKSRGGLSLKSLRVKANTPTKLEEILQKGKLKKISFIDRHKKKNKETVDLEITIQPINYRNKKSAFVCINDKTEHEKFKSDAIEYFEKFKIIADTASDGIIIINSGGKILFCNKALEKIFGYSPDEILDKKVNKFIPGYLRILHSQINNNYTLTNKKNLNRLNIEMPGLHKGGHEIQLEISFGKYTKENEIYFTGVIRDVSLRKKSEKRLSVQFEVTKIISETVKLEKAYPKIIKAICKGLTWEAGEYWEIDDKAETIKFKTAYASSKESENRINQISQSYEFSRGEGLPGKVWDTGKPDLILNIIKDKNFFRKKIADELNLKSIIAFPIPFGKNPYAAMLFFKSNVVEPDEEIIKMFEAIGKQIGGLVEKKRYEESLHLEQDKLESKVKSRTELLLNSNKILKTEIKRREQSEKELLESRRKYKLLVDGVKDYAIYLLDKQGNIVNWNSGAKRLKGYSANEVIGKNFSMFFSPEDKRKDSSKKLLRQAEKEGRVEEEGWRIKKDGTRFFANAVITPLYDEQGKLYGYAKVTRDITAKVQSEAALRESQEHYRLLLEGIKDYAIFMIDSQGYITNWNTGAKKIKGYEAKEIIGKHYSIFYTPEDKERQKPKRNLRLALEHGRYEEEAWRLRKDGSKFFADVIITPLRDEKGKLLGFVKVTRDITERKIAEEALKKAHEGLEQKVQERTKELEKVNSILKVEVIERKQAVFQLQERVRQQETIVFLSQQALQIFDLQTIFDEAVKLITKTLNVEFGKVLKLMPGGKELLIVSGVGWKPNVVGKVTVDAEKGSQAGYTLKVNHQIIVDDIKNEKRFKIPKLLTDHNILSGIAVVIGPEKNPFGVLGAHSIKKKDFSKEDVRFLETVANVLASAIERKKVEGELQDTIFNLNEAREKTEFAQRRLSFLAEASIILNSSLDYRRTLTSLANLSTPEVADWCIIDMLDDEGKLKRLTVSHADLQKIEKVYQLQQKYSTDQSLQSELNKVIKSGTSIIHPQINEEDFKLFGLAEEQLSFSRKAGMKSAMIVPLSTREKVVGTISFISAESGLIYNENDLKFVEDLARRASSAIENAILFNETKLLNKKLAKRIEDLNKEIKERIKVENALVESRKLLHNTVNAAPLIIWAIDNEGKISLLEGKALSKFNINPKDFVGKNVNNFLTDWPNVTEILRRVKLGEEYITIIEINGIPLETRFSPIKKKNKIIGVIVVAFDISERKKAEEDRAMLLVEIENQRRRLNNIIANVPGVVWETWRNPDPAKLRTNFVSEFIEKMLGYSVDDWLSDPAFWLTIVHPDDRKQAAEVIQEIFEKKLGGLNTFRWITKNGKEIWVETHVVVIIDENKKPVGLRGVSMDITQRKLAEEQIEASLKEKEVLLREIHHRVKNNLQLISSLLNLQSQYIKDKKALDIFIESQNRIKSMALIHEKLYKPKDLSSINFAEYVNDLALGLFDSYNIPESNIRLVVDMPNIFLTIDIAISLGLIINEAVSNAIKHAFPPDMLKNGGKGEIIIRMYEDENDEWIVILKDNGKGFPENINFRETESLGLQLINTLVEQHNGTIELIKNNGTEFFIALPKEEEE